MKNKSWPALLCWLIVGALFSACGAPAATPAPVAAPTAAPAASEKPFQTAPTTSPAQISEVRLLTRYTGGPAEESVYQRCGVKSELVGWSEYRDKLKAMIASGAAPDLILVNTTDVASFANDGMLAAIKDTPGVTLGDFFPPLVDAFVFQGQLYAVPRDFTTLALFFNRDLFDQLGLQYPTDDWTWKDLRDAADVIASKSGVPGFYAPDEAWNFAPFVVQGGGRIMTPNFSGTLFDSPGAIEAGNFLADGFGKGWAITQEKLGIGWWEAFGEQKVAMVLGPFSYIGYLADQYPKLNYGVTHPPAGPGGKGTSLSGMAYAVPANAPAPHASMDAIACLTSEESQRQLLEAGQILPSRQVLEKHPYLQDHPAAWTIFTGIYLPTIPENWGPRHQEVEGIVGQALKKVYQGGMPVDQSFKWAAEEIRTILKQ